MRRHPHVLAFAIAAILFFIPFFWLKPGFVDLGGDSSRLYFIDPLATVMTIWNHRSTDWAPQYSMIPYELFLLFLKQIIWSPTNLINFERGLQLSLGFLSIYFISIELIKNRWAAITSGFAYLALITRFGWTLSLVTQNQVFLNPLIFYLILKEKLWLILLSTLFFSGNFGFSAAPNLFSFYPFAVAYLLILKKVRWRFIAVLALTFFVVHAMSLIPMIISFLSPYTQVHQYVLSGQSIQNSGVHYFDMNHVSLGKISIPLLQPTIVIPMIIVLSFITSSTRVMVVTGGFFALALFLVSANITNVGTSLYRLLFYIPGFMMFRSFNEKWYYVFAFFYAILFGISFKKFARPFISLTVIAVLVYTLVPFLQGRQIYTPHYQSKNVSPVFSIDPNLLDALMFVKALPPGKFLTLPLTFSYYQIAYGKEGGAYVGPSMVLNISGRDDYPGFWGMGWYAEPVFNALRADDWKELLLLFKNMGIRYIFYNSDTRIMDNFPDYPYIYPGLMYSSKDQVPAIRDQEAYENLLLSLPLTKSFEKGFYSIYEINY